MINYVTSDDEDLLFHLRPYSSPTYLKPLNLIYKDFPPPRKVE